ncbi:hypothetical protein ABW20_dc0106527 [Dactylellina cionopaga]|nr:hypothetical protein ABW20_dc0106527 [Dactylellina cionopaga]
MLLLLSSFIFPLLLFCAACIYQLKRSLKYTPPHDSSATISDAAKQTGVSHNKPANSPPPPLLGNKIPTDDPTTRSCHLVSQIPPGSLEIPHSVVDRMCDCALRSFECERLTEENDSVIALYVLPNGDCEMALDGDEVPEEWVRVPERVIEFLADAVLSWVAEGGGEYVEVEDRYESVEDDYIETPKTVQG